MKKDKNCVIENIAFGESNGEIVVKLFDNNSPINSLRNDLMNPELDAVSQKVKVQKLDDYCFDSNISHIDLLKIDAEGYELLILEGSNSMLKQENIGMIYCETGFIDKDKRHVKFDVLLNLLEKTWIYFFWSL